MFIQRRALHPFYMSICLSISEITVICVQGVVLQTPCHLSHTPGLGRVTWMEIKSPWCSGVYQSCDNDIPRCCLKIPPSSTSPAFHTRMLIPHTPHHDQNLPDRPSQTMVKLPPPPPPHEQGTNNPTRIRGKTASHEQGSKQPRTNKGSKKPRT